MRAQMQGYSTCTRSAEDPKTPDGTRTAVILELRQTINEFIYSTKSTEYEPCTYCTKRTIRIL
jgi:hypothetical protein